MSWSLVELGRENNVCCEKVAQESRKMGDIDETYLGQEQRHRCRNGLLGSGEERVGQAEKVYTLPWH